MMLNAYSLPPKKARICRIAATLFLALAAILSLYSLSVAAFPGPRYDCEGGECSWKSDVSRLLEEDRRPVVVAAPTARAALDAYAARPVVRAWLFVGAMVQGLPFAFLLLVLARALRRLAAADGYPLADALPWLRRASQVAILAAIADPIGNSIIETTLSIGTPGGLEVPLDLTTAFTNLMLALVARITAWALEAGVKAQHDLAEIV
ncbi:hypothetical protein ACFSC3_15605 [Sphingomonas floccifaciens]|uniref:DUF2975 domain-containing protein n=1 Tax=Sphingomonas floccifaciens TaxID=1844115 RepID=A0ABW4NGQ1_9SPHN